MVSMNSTRIKVKVAVKKQAVEVQQRRLRLVISRLAVPCLFGPLITPSHICQEKSRSPGKKSEN